MTEADKKLLEEKKERVRITLKHGKADKIPFIMWRPDYLVHFYGYKPAEMTYDKMFEVLKRGAEELHPDIQDCMEPFKLSYPWKREIMKGSMYKVSEDFNYVQVDKDHLCIMKPEDYDAFIANPVDTLLETILPRRLEILTDKYTADEKLEALRKFEAAGAPGRAFRKKYAEEVPVLASSHCFWSAPGDTLLDCYRDFTGVSIDIKRNPQKVLDYCEIWADRACKAIENAPVIDYSTSTAAMHLPPYLSPKDFEKVYWPSFKRVLDCGANRGIVAKLLFEKSWKHLFDFLLDTKKDSIIGYFEKEDGFGYTCEKIGHHVIVAGGIETELLAMGTKEQCVNSVRNNIDKYCQDGGRMLCADLPMVFAVDGKPENFRAVAETIDKYSWF